MPFTVLVEPRALADIQQAMDYYDSVQPGLGKNLKQLLTSIF